MADDPVIPLQAARSGYVARRRDSPRQVAHRLPGDPAWMHEGFTIRLRVSGVMVDLFGVGSLAAGADVSPGTVRRWEASGLLPAARYRTPGRAPAGRKRLYSREFLLAVRDAVNAARDGRRRMPPDAGALAAGARPS